MEFLINIFKNYKLILRMGYNDFRNKFSSTSLGIVWGFISPIIFICTYVFVFEYVLKVQSSGDYPFIIWFIPGIAVWFFISEAIVNGSNSIRTYSYLVKKIVFPVDIIPLITTISGFIVTITIMVLISTISSIFGYVPDILKMLYLLVCVLVLIVVITRATAALTTLVPDFGQVVTIGTQLLFWFTPIIWNINMLSGWLRSIISYSPFNYIINGMRECFIGGDMISLANIKYTIVFWLLIILLFVYANYIFNKNKKDFSDVL